MNPLRSHKQKAKSPDAVPNKNNLLSFKDSINWLKKRHQKTAHNFYLKTREEIQQDKEIEEVFTKIDYNQNGKIDMRELHYMFLSNGIKLSRVELEKFFDFCKAKSKGYLTFQEFKELYKNPYAEKLFRFFINRARQENDEVFGEGVNQVYLPYNMSRLLEHMSLKHRREELHNRIEEEQGDYEKITSTVKNFIKLFIIDQSALDTVSKDEWSRKISQAKIRKQH